jgi:hypothetical protein
MVSQKLLKILSQIIKEEYGANLDKKTIMQMAENWVGTYDLLAKIYHRMEEDK